MDHIIHTFLNLVFPPISLITFFFILPTYSFFKFLSFIIRSISSEDVAGKVVLITGASSGIGEYIAYEYAKRGAYLALVGRRENRLREVAGVAEFLGSPYALIIPADVSKIEDCKRFIDITIDNFGRLDHLVNNAGITSINLIEEYDKLSNVKSIMDTNFWGTVYSTYYAIPHLKFSRGKIIAISSSASWLPVPRMSLYSASKAAVTSFYETMRVEVGKEIGITIVTPGMVESEMTAGKFLSKEGQMYFDQELRDAAMSAMPVMSRETAAKAIVRSACRGDRYVTEPRWMRITFYWKLFYPEIIESMNYLFIMARTSPTDTLGKRVLDLTGLKDLVYPASIRSPQLSHSHHED